MIANQWTGFYMTETSVMKELNVVFLAWASNSPIQFSKPLNRVAFAKLRGFKFGF